MHLETLRQFLGSADRARSTFQVWNLRDHERGWRNLTHPADAIGIDALKELGTPLGRFLPRCPDPDMALNNLERFLANPAGAEQLPALLENQSRVLELLLQLLGTSQHFSDLRSHNPDYLDLLGGPVPRSPSKEELQAEL